MRFLEKAEKLLKKYLPITYVCHPKLQQHLKTWTCYYQGLGISQSLVEDYGSFQACS